MDDSDVALLELELPPGEFEKFEVERGAKATLEVRRLMNALQQASNSDDFLRIEVNGNKVRLLYPRTKRCFEVPRLISVVEEPPALKLFPQAGAELDVRALRVMLRDASLLKQDGEKPVEIAVGPKGIAFRAEDGDGGRYEMCLLRGDSGLHKISCHDGSAWEVRSAFSLEYLKKVISDKWRRIRLHLGDESPLIVEYGVGKRGKLMVYLAPFIKKKGGFTGKI
jgi:hypothetical protein